jgi:multidrug efflux pump subunit AcrA (membrane-fusion protein)
MLTLALLASLLAPDDEEFNTHLAKKGALTPVLELDASYESVDTLEVRLRFDSGAVDAALKSVAPHGKAVKKGDILLALDRAPVERLVAAAETDLRAARAALDKAKADRELGTKADALALAHAEHAVADAVLDLKLFDEVEGKQMLLNAELALKQSEDVVHDQQEEIAQLEKMYKTEELTNATAEIVVRRARRGLDRAKVYAGMAREALDAAKTRHPQQRRRSTEAVETARASLAQLKAAQALSAVQRDVELAKAEAAARQGEDQLAKLRRDLEALTVAAPFDGLVFWGAFANGQWPPLEQAGQALHVGDKPQAGTVLLTLCGTALRARADLPEADYFSVDLGSPVRVAPVSRRDRAADGRVAAKGVVAQARGAAAAFDARIDFDAPPADLLPGMKAKATLKGRELKDVVLVPATAVASTGDKSTVKVVKDGKAVEKEIKVGRGDGTLVPVFEGLAEGDAVAVPK